MRFMVFVKATKRSEAGVLPTAEEFSTMGKFNQELIDAGILLDGNGLKPSSAGAKVRFGTGQRTVVDGPFAEAKEIVAGYWLWQCKSLEEAVEWVKRCPDPMPGEESEIEIRPVFEMTDFPELPDEVRKLELDRAKR